MPNYYDYYAYPQRPSTFSIIFWLAITVVMLVSMWKIFEKAGKPGWAAIVPFYNLYILFEITWGKGIMFLLLLIPIANIVFAIMAQIKLAKAFGKEIGFAIGLILLSPVFMPILAFGPAQYLGVPGGAFSSPGYQPPQQNYQPPQQGYPSPPQANRPQQGAPKAFCPQCGKENVAGGAFCAGCGNRL